MTEPQPDDDAMTLFDETARWQRQLDRQSRIARWMVIPYALCGLLLGAGIASVVNAGMPYTSAALIVGTVGALCGPWLSVVLLHGRRRDES